MNSANFKEWLTEKVLPNIEDKTVIVIDNAPLAIPSKQKNLRNPVQIGKEKKCRIGLRIRTLLMAKVTPFYNYCVARCTEID